MHLEVPIIGTGTRDDPFRADLPDGADYQACIPTGPDGRPLHMTCVVVVADGSRVPARAKALSQNEARTRIRNQDPKADPTVMERGDALRQL